MKASKINLVNAIAFVLMLPTAYFILISLLKYVFNIDAPFDLSEELLKMLKVQEGLGWSINLLILLGPLLAFLLTIFQVLKIRVNTTNEQLLFQLAIQKERLPLLLAGLSIGLMVILFVYAIGEDCSCNNMF